MLFICCGDRGPARASFFAPTPDILGDCCRLGSDAMYGYEDPEAAAVAAMAAA
jgi:hypothetical protein